MCKKSFLNKNGNSFQKFDLVRSKILPFIFEKRVSPKKCGIVDSMNMADFSASNIG